MSTSRYTVAEEGETLKFEVLRSGGAFVTRKVQWKIDPKGDEQFYFGRGALTFLPNERRVIISPSRRTTKP